MGGLHEGLGQRFQGDACMLPPSRWQRIARRGGNWSLYMILPLCLLSFPHLYLGCWEQPLLNFAGLYFVSLSENQISSSIHCWIPFPYDLPAINPVKNRFSDTPMPQKIIAYFLPIGWLKKWICIYTSIHPLHYFTLHYTTLHTFRKKTSQKMMFA